MKKWQQEELCLDERIKALISEMTIEEKVSQLTNSAAGLSRLGIQKYDWWNEALHGVARAGEATVFPQAIGLAATWNDGLIKKAADVISTEARAKYNEAQRQGNHERYYGLTFWSPNVNIFRDPRWGRGQETYGEDPYLTSKIAEAFIGGLQGNSKHLKAAACAKHFAAHSGPEAGRECFNSVISEKDLRETYLAAFENCVKNAGVEAVMGAYNALNGVPCCCNRRLLKGILREEWGFQGHVVSDCGAIHHIAKNHKYVDGLTKAAAVALKSGCDLNCGTVYEHLVEAYEQDLISEEDLDEALIHTLRAKFKLGMFDSKTEYDDIPMSVVASEEHKHLCQEVTRESFVLLKNDGTLPLDKTKYKKIAVIGPNADSLQMLLGNYNGEPTQYSTVYRGFCELCGEENVLCEKGCGFFGEDDETLLQKAEKAAKKADAVVLALGLDASFEGEEGDANNPYGAGDRPNIELPAPQEELFKRMAVTGKKLIVFCFCGGAVALCDTEKKVNAVIQGWYPGEFGGIAAAELVFGVFSPSGRLPVTFYRSTADLPAFTDYSMKNRTYRYFKGEVLYPFGFGLSYSSFSLNCEKKDEYTYEVTVSNTGKMDAFDTVQLYLSEKNAPGQPIKKLAAFTKVFVRKASFEKVVFHLTKEAFTHINDDGEKEYLSPEHFKVVIE